MTKLLSLFAVAIAVALSACSTNIASDYRMSPQSATGLAIGSITYTGALGARQIVLQNVATGEYTKLEVGQAQTLNPFARPEVDPDLKQVGGTFATELPAGNYIVATWNILQGPSRVFSTTPIELPFTVVAGSAIYLGNFHFEQTSRFGLGTGSALVTLEDKSTRDLSVLKARYPVLANIPIEASIAAGTKLVGIGGASNKSFSNYVPIFVPVKR